MNNLPISVIITTYNDTGYLAQAIESVLEQTQPPKQLIIVDDGSESYMSKVISHRYINNNFNIQIEYYRKDNGGAASARNVSLQHVNQPYIAFLDADDKFLKDSLEKRYKELSLLENNYFGVYGSAITTQGPNQNFVDFDGNAPPHMVGDFNQGIPGGCYYYLFRTQALKEIGYLDEKLSHNEDFDFIIRLLKTGMYCKGSVGYTHQITIRENSLSRDLNYEKVFNGIMAFLDKAEKESYFDRAHLKNRKKYAHLFLAKRALKKRPLFAVKHILLASKYL